MSMSADRIDKWIWVLIYVGLITFALGFAVQRSDAAIGGAMVAIGALLIAAGALLVWIRSRMNVVDKPKKKLP